MRKLGPILAAVAVAGALAGCATPYQEMGFLGGVEGVRITGDTAQITARGNAYTPPEIIQRYALRKAAELTVNAGYDLFEIQGEQNQTRVGSTSTGYATGDWNSAFGVSTTTPIIKPGQTLMIRMSKGALPETRPAGLYDAHEVLAFLGPDENGDKRDCVNVGGKIECGPQRPS